MKAPKEYRKIINRMRKKWGRKNGVIKSNFLDHPFLEMMWETSKGKYKRNKNVDYD